MSRLAHATLTVALTLHVAACAAEAQHTGPATAPATVPAVIDPHLWARRNLDLLREAAGRKDAWNVFAFSVPFNPMLSREPYLAETLRLAEEALAKVDKGRESELKTLREQVEFLRRPAAEREARAALRNAPHLATQPVTEEDVYRAADDLAGVPNGPVYEDLVPRLVEQMDAAARRAGKWDELGLAYFTLAHDAHRRNRSERSSLYVDRLLGILRERPQFQDPRRGSTNGPMPQSVAALLLQLDRRRDLDALIAASTGGERVALAAGLAAELAKRGALDEVSQIVEREIAPTEPAAAERVRTTLAGGTPPPPERRRAKDPPATQRVIVESAVLGIEYEVARAHARRGDIETAARQMLARPANARFRKVGPGELGAGDWLGLAVLAQEGGHDEAARRGSERALAALERDATIEPPERVEKARFVREAVAVGDWELAQRVLGTTSRPGVWARHRLAVRYRDRGDLPRADALWDEVIAMSRGRERGTGETLARMAVQFHAMGRRERAEQLLIDALPRIHGEDFGFGGTHAVVTAAARINRPDLLDRLYETSDPGDRMLLCIVASRIGSTPAQPGPDASADED